MKTSNHKICHDLFHCCALRAYVEVACQSGQWPPDSEATRRLAEHYYESSLAGKITGPPEVLP